FWYGIKDSEGLITSAPITVVVSEGGGIPTPTPPPQAEADTAETTSGQMVTIDVLANDTGKHLSIKKVDNPAPYPSGSASIVDNKIHYTAPVNFVGTSTFWYQIEDAAGQLTSNAIEVTVTAPTIDAPYPTAGNDTAQTMLNQPITIAPLWNDTGEELKITSVDTTTAVLWNKVEIVGDDKVLYTPTQSTTGNDSFWYVVTDKHGRTNAAEIVVSVAGNNAGAYPTAGSDTYTVDRFSTGNVFDVFSNDTGSGLTFKQLYEGTTAGGRTYDNGGSVRYDAPTDPSVDTDDFWYSIEDSSGRTNAAKVTITIRDPDNGGANEAPDAVEDILRSEINAAEFEIDVLSNDTDPNGDVLTVASVEPARSGVVRLVGGKVLYTPPSITTSDTFVYTISDSRGGTASAAATIGVTDPNNPTNNPIINNEFVTVAPGGSVIIKVLDNDSDPDGDTLILDQVTGGSQGTTQKVADDNGDLNWVEYQALGNASGTDEFFYGVADGLGGNGSGKVTITFE
ncbi:MAG: Ig-like domain-containing protein, partial [Leucothrix sp.]